MSALSIVNEGLGQFAINGDLNFFAIDKKIANSFAFLSSTKQVTVDLAGVKNADSAGLALLIEWLKYARTKKVQLRFKNIPEQLLNLAKISSLDKTAFFITSQFSEAATV
jgi:phospholipid transport system transporter-binding protein